MNRPVSPSPSPSDLDQYRPPEPAGRRLRRLAGGIRKRKPRAPTGGPTDGSAEMSMVPDADFSSYYGRNIVKPPPWGHEVPAYLALGGIAGGSGLLALGAQLTGRDILRRNTRLGALAAISLGGAALVKDLGRPERFYNMLRTVKLTSPMSIGSWILTAYSAGMGVAGIAEIDRMTGERLPLGPLRGVLQAVEPLAGFEAAAFGPPLAAYTAVLLSDTANPTWNAAHKDLPFVFVSSASLAASGLAMITTPVRETGPARALAIMGVVADIGFMKYMESRMDPTAAEPLHHGKAGRMLKQSEWLAIAGAVGTLLVGRTRLGAIASGICLVGASSLTRFGVFEAGMDSARDPRYTVEPQRRRLAARRAAGITDDSITTAT